MLFIPFSITAAKTSIILLYHRIFGIDHRSAIGIRVVGTLNILWMLAAFFGLVFECRPVSFAWDPIIVKGTCFNISLFTVLIEIPNSLLDFVMMAIPISMIRKLQIPLHEKLILIFIFLLGGM